MVMEYCRCGSVSRIFSKVNLLIEEQLREIASCCVLGLNTLHSSHIIHRVCDCGGE